MGHQATDSMKAGNRNRLDRIAKKAAPVLQTLVFLQFADGTYADGKTAEDIAKASQGGHHVIVLVPGRQSHESTKA
jgi:hypothetical protein